MSRVYHLQKYIDTFRRPDVVQTCLPSTTSTNGSLRATVRTGLMSKPYTFSHPAKSPKKDLLSSIAAMNKEALSGKSNPPSVCTAMIIKAIFYRFMAPYQPSISCVKNSWQHCLIKEAISHPFTYNDINFWNWKFNVLNFASNQRHNLHEVTAFSSAALADASPAC
eukprot:m.271292 g.271292  ORF g.271292 m.271292 type:complete len:166 (+) comp40550_c0_seq10:78-575(+)